eukprot:31176-Pelagococcus_subviridis.AAC.25
MRFITPLTSASVISYAQCSIVCLTTGDTDGSSYRLFAYTHFLHRFVFHRPLPPATPTQRDICRASSAVRLPS